jgi:hypothetical protein
MTRFRLVSIIRGFMSRYRVRPATLDDLEVLVRLRLAMFLDMGAAAGEVAEVGAPFSAWLRDAMARGMYRAWLVETDTGEIVAGGGNDGKSETLLASAWT